MKTIKLPLLVVFCLLCCQLASHAQKTPYLERLVTIKVYNQSLAEVFKSIASQTDVVFSYTKFDDQRKVTASHFKQPLRVVLNDLLKETNCSYKIKDKYVILNCSDKPKKASSDVFHLSGYVYSAADSSRVENVSIYVKENRHSATTNKYGYFSFSFPQTANASRISVARENFRDTTLLVSAKNKVELNIFIQPRPVNAEVYASIDPKALTSIPLEKDTVPVASVIDTTQADRFGRRIPLDTGFHNLVISGFNFWEKLKQKNLSLKNIDDTLFQTVSFSLVPYVSTNRLLSINTVNKYSFNLLAGQSKGVDVLELGVLLNIDNGNVKYAQVAGLVNVVSGDVTGGQTAGLVNYVGGNSKAFQVAGLVNIVKGNAEYAQVSGLGNVVNNDLYGAQIGGIFNQNRNTFGTQFSGIVSVTNNLNGFQVSGITSMAKNKVNGAQISGLVNKADTVNGTQIAGLFNSARVMNGFQLSGLINRAHQLKGVQLGFMNFSNTCIGLPIGFFSYVHKGYHKIELSADENLYGTIALRTGVNQFHNIFLGGINLQEPGKSYTYGYGLGSAWQMSPKWYFDLDLTGQHIQAINQPFYLNSLGKAFFGFEFRPWEKVNLAFGPTYNVFVSEVSEFNTLTNSFAPYHFFDYTEGGINVKMWIGGKIALRFL